MKAKPAKRRQTLRERTVQGEVEGGGRGKASQAREPGK